MSRSKTLSLRTGLFHSETQSFKLLHQADSHGIKVSQTNGTSQDKRKVLNGLPISAEGTPQPPQSAPLPSPSVIKSLRQRLTGVLGSARTTPGASQKIKQSVTQRPFQDGLVRQIEKNYYEAYTEVVHISLAEKWDKSVHPKLQKAVEAVVRGIGLQPQEMYVNLALLMVGPKVGDMLHLLPTIVISCCHKTAKTKIEDLVDSNQLDYLGEFACPHLVCYKEREPKRRDRFFADTDSCEEVESSGDVSPYDLSFERQRYMSFGVEQTTGRKSACGLPVHFTYSVPNVHNDELERGTSDRGRWIARIGGVIQIGGKPFAMTTAHPFLLQSSGEGSKASIGSDAIVDGYLDVKSDEHGDEADYKANLAAKGIHNNPSVRIGRGAFRGYFAFCGHGRSFDCQDQISLKDSNSDWCILSMDSLRGLINCYRVEDLKGEAVEFNVDKILGPGEVARPGVVHILDSPEKPMAAYMTQTTASIYFGGNSLNVRRLISKDPLSAGLSGCWVVRGQHLLGHIIGGNEFERTLYMIPVQDTKNAIEQITGGSPSLELTSNLVSSKEVVHRFRDTQTVHRKSPLQSGPTTHFEALRTESYYTNLKNPQSDQRESAPRSVGGSRAGNVSLQSPISSEAFTKLSERSAPEDPEPLPQSGTGHSNVWYEDPESGDTYRDHINSKGRTIRTWRKLPKEASRAESSATPRARRQSVFDRLADEYTSRRQREKSRGRESSRGDRRPSYTESVRHQSYQEDSDRYADAQAGTYFDSSYQSSTSYRPRHLSPSPFDPGTGDSLAESLDALHVSGGGQYTHSTIAASPPRDWQPPVASSRHEETPFLLSDVDHSQLIYSSHDYYKEQSPAATQSQEQGLNRVIKGTPDLVARDSSYRVWTRDYKQFFKIGRVFSIPWADYSGKNRHFIVVREGERFISCLPVTSYSNKGIEKSGIRLDEHGFIYSKNKPGKVEGMCLRPLKLILTAGASHLRDSSLVNYGEVYNIETIVMAKSVGTLDGDSAAILLRYCRRIYSGIEDPGGATPRASEAVLSGVGEALNSYPAAFPAASYIPATSSESRSISASPMTGYPPAASTSYYGPPSDLEALDGRSAYDPPSSQHEPSPSVSSYQLASSSYGMDSALHPQNSTYAAPSMHSQTQYVDAPRVDSPQEFRHNSGNIMDTSHQSSIYQPPASSYPHTGGGAYRYGQPISGYGQPSEEYSPQSGYTAPQYLEPADSSSVYYDDDIDLVISDPPREATIAKRWRESKSD